MKRMIAAMLAMLMLLSMAVPVAAEDEAPGDTPYFTDGPTAEPTETPTPTAEPTAAPAETATPAPEEAEGTPEPTATPEAGMEPAESPLPTDTPAPLPENTESPEPSATPEPDADAEPTATPEPDTDAEPTETPDPDASAEPDQTPDPEASEEPEETPEPSMEPVAPVFFSDARGQIDVTVKMALETAWTPSFNVLLSGAELSQQTVTAGGTVSFTGLAAGDHTLTISGTGFATYTQTVSLGESDGVTIRLTVGKLAGYDGAVHYGVLRIGDVDGDGDIDGDDRLMMMRTVAGESSEGFTDLNGDGETTLADAEYLAKGLNAGTITATEEHFVPAAAVAATAREDVTLSGQESLFVNDGTPFTAGNGAAISQDNPVEVYLNLASGATTDVIMLEQTNIDSGEIDIILEDGSTFRGVISGGTDMIAMIAAVPTVNVTRDGSGNIVVDLGGQKAVKKVTLRITSTTDAADLASISQVEFVNGMADRIPEPKMDVPANVTAVGASRQFTVSWLPCVNVTGYQVMVSDGVHEPEITPVTGTSLTVTGYGGDELLNYTTYTVQVQSVNGTWTSGWSESVSVMPKPTGRPDKPDNVKAVGGYESVTVSWKNMKDTSGYDLFYKREGEGSFTKIPDLTATSYTITGLDSSQATTYEVYVVGKNEFGDSEPSMHASAQTVTLLPAEMPRFNLINRDSTGRPGRDHILAASQMKGTMHASPLDTADGTAWGTVDNDPASYYERMSWDDGGYNWEPGGERGLSYVFDGVYTLDTIGMMSAVDSNMDYTYIKIRWFDADGGSHLISYDQMSSERRTDSQSKTYFFLRLPYPVSTNQIQIGTARYWAGNPSVNVSEVYFYRYDPLKGELRALYADDLHTTLVEGVTEQQLNDLKARIEASADEFGEPNPDKAQLLREWETAWQIYHDQFAGSVTRVHGGITASGDEHGFGGLNAWQPLGVTAAAGESVTVYVGSANQKTGAATNLQLVATQYYAESSAMSKVLTTLKVGANEVRIPKIWTNTGMESGGALYVQYTGGARADDVYAVRVSGGTPVPVLDLYHVTDQATRLERVTAYLTELQSYAASLEQTHTAVHQGESASKEVQYAYDARTCILGASDIMLDTMMLSLPAQQILAGCGGNAQTLLGSLDAMEQMMDLFYQHKGLNASAPNSVDQIPKRHLNIRYQRMFSGAFMYASGDHIGIGWNETAGMAGCGGVTADGNGLYQSGNYFGWGIAHEIGHDINQGSYAIAEITNNYFAVLAQAHDTNDSVRFEYPKVYEKVTSGTKGRAGNVFTQLGMYWQLHLAYDKGWNFKTYSDYGEQLNNLFWARVDTYARTPSRAPHGLSLAGADMEQTLMRLCCAAANRNILGFFERWGKTPDADTIAYASQFEKETRAIYYVCDDSRRYTLERGGTGKLAADGTTEAIASATAAVQGQANHVLLTLTSNGTVSDEEILGYEIVRCTVSSGKVEKKTVGFTTSSNFTDVVAAMNNRAVYYEVTLVDQYLNRSAVMRTNTLKIQHEGDLDKTYWAVTTQGLEATAVAKDGDEWMPEGEEEDVALRMADGKADTVYTAVVGEGAGIMVDFRQIQVVAGFRYTAGSDTPITGYSMDVLQNGQWVHAAEGTLTGNDTVYFSNTDGLYVSTYAAEAIYLRLTGQLGQTISVAELDVLGPTGDNVDISSADGGASIGYLEADFHYGKEPTDVIPAGSLVFTGTYSGNAAYNVVVLYDQDGEIVAAPSADGTKSAYQAILAALPDTGKIQDVASGAWVYWLQPEDLVGYTLPSKVRVELYRVNDAMTNEGKRLVSDTLFVDVPAEPGKISLTGAGGVG